jgi:hypothetical protein
MSAKYSQIHSDEGAEMYPRLPSRGVPTEEEMPVPSAPHFTENELSTDTIYQPHYAQIPPEYVVSTHAPSAPQVVPVALPVAIPIAPVASLPQEVHLVPTVPPVPTEAQLLERTRTSNATEFQMSRYLHEGWQFLKPNLCVFVMAELLWALIFIGLFLLTVIIINHLFPLEYYSDEEDPYSRHSAYHMSWSRFLFSLLLLLANIVLIVTPCVSSWFIAIFNAMRTNTHVKFADFFAAFSCQYYCRLVGLGFVLAFFRHVLSFLFYFPGIWFALVTVFAIPLHHEHPSLGIWKSMKFSANVVHRHFCCMFGFVILLGLLQILGLLCLGVGLLITIPLAHIALCYAYHYLIGVNGVAVYMPQPVVV